MAMAAAERRQQWRVRSFYSLSNILNINKEKDLTFFAFPLPIHGAARKSRLGGMNYCGAFLSIAYYCSCVLLK